jgi:elongation factor G
MWACETAVFFVNAVTGIGVNTRSMWKAAGEMGKARVVVVSRMDMDNADPERVFEQLRSAFGPECRLYNLPVGAGQAFQAVVPCFDPERPVPGATLCGDPAEARNAFFEAVVEVDDGLLERYLSGEEIPHAEVAGALTHALVAGHVVPVLFLSSARGHGLGQLLDFLAEYAPGADRPFGIDVRDAAGEPAEVSSEGPFLASVFKVTSDVHVGKVSFLRVWRGRLAGDGTVWNSATDGTVRLGTAHPSRPQGKDLQPVTEVAAGDVVCVTKLDDLELGATLADPAHRLRVVPPRFPVPMVHLAAESRSKGDEHKVSVALSKLGDEDPSFRSVRNPETHELVLSGLSSLHLDVVLRRLAHRYKLDLETRLPRVPLKETVMGRADGHYRHKKQTGGRGQFGEVYLRAMATERGTGFVFEDVTVGGSIPHNFIPAVEKGVREAMERGVVAGYPVVDVKVEVFDGKSHPVDSSETAFKIAGGRAFRNAVLKAKPALLEPIMNIEIDVPVRCMGDVTSDLNTRRGRIVGMDSHDDRQVVRAQVPLSEVLRYSTDLRSMTSGEGVYTLELSHLDAVPGNLAQKMMAAFEAGRTDED